MKACINFGQLFVGFRVAKFALQGAENKAIIFALESEHIPRSEGD